MAGVDFKDLDSIPSSMVAKQVADLGEGKMDGDMISYHKLHEGSNLQPNMWQQRMHIHEINWRRRKRLKACGEDGRWNLRISTMSRSTPRRIASSRRVGAWLQEQFLYVGGGGHIVGVSLHHPGRLSSDGCGPSSDWCPLCRACINYRSAPRRSSIRLNILMRLLRGAKRAKVGEEAARRYRSTPRWSSGFYAELCRNDTWEV